jgi:hypothetical protein
MFVCFYMLNGVNELSLKRVFFASFPDDLHNDMERLIQSTNRPLEEFGLRELSNIVHEVLNLLCEKHAATEKFFKQKRALKKVCKKNFEIGYPKHGTCDCKPSKFTKKKKRRFPPVRSSLRRQRKFQFSERSFNKNAKSIVVIFANNKDIFCKSLSKEKS